ncbi:hypothetical protein ZWY2020_040739 [Hordeum vulgare]|nr:hypothetical protein ZWY2020_040739 [Hordeum vulgare]
MTASSSSARIQTTHHPAGHDRSAAIPLLPSAPPLPISASASQGGGPGDGDRANGRTGVPVPFSRDAAIALPSPVRPIIPAAAPTIFVASVAVRNAPESMPAVASTPANLSTAVKDDESMSFPPRRPSLAVNGIGLGRSITRGLTSQALAAPISVGTVPGNGSITAIPAVNDLSKRNISNTDERVNSGGLSQQLVSPLGSKIQQQPVLKTNDAVSSDSSNTSESAVLGGRVFSSPVVPGAQWRAQTLAGFQNQSETVHTFALVDLLKK